MNADTWELVGAWPDSPDAFLEPAAGQKPSALIFIFSLALKEKNRSLTVIDHHLTAERALKDLSFCYFDMSHCGSVLSWHYCNGQDQEPPLLLKYIEDQDLWKWQMPSAKEIMAVITLYLA